MDLISTNATYSTWAQIHRLRTQRELELGTLSMYGKETEYSDNLITTHQKMAFVR